MSSAGGWGEGLNLPLGQTSTNTSWAEAAANYYIQFLIFKKTNNSKN